MFLAKSRWSTLEKISLRIENETQNKTKLAPKDAGTCY